MKFILKILIFLFLSSSILITGYEAVKYARDSVRILNMQTIVKALDIFYIKKGYYPVSGEGKNVSKMLVEKDFIGKEIRDPVFTSSTVIMDQYANNLLHLFDKVIKFANPELKEKMSILKDLSSEEIPPDFVIAYLSDGKTFEFSVKLESFIVKKKMIEDEGNDDNRY